MLLWQGAIRHMCHCRTPSPITKANECGSLACFSVMARPRFLGCNDAGKTKAGGRSCELRAYHLRSRRRDHDRHAQSARQAERLYRPDGRRNRRCVPSRRRRRQCPRDHRHRRRPRLLRRRRRFGRRGEFRHFGQAWRRRLRQRRSRAAAALSRRSSTAGNRRSRRSTAGRRRRHHHDVADGVRIAARGAKIGFIFARRGLVPEAGSAWFLPKLVGLPQALRWCLSGRTFDADEAKAGGLVSDVVEPRSCSRAQKRSPAR